MKIRKFGIYLADLNPARGTEPGKVRPVVVVQTDLMNGYHPSTIVCPMTTKIEPRAKVLRISVSARGAGLERDSEILPDQIRAIDNRRLIKKLGVLHLRQQSALRESLRVIILE